MEGIFRLTTVHVGPVMLSESQKRMGRSREGTPHGWVQKLEGAVERLTELNASTEKDFLLLGERLQDTYLRAKEISESSSTISGRMSGEETTAVMTELRGVLSRVKGLEEESQTDMLKLSSMSSGFDDVRKQLMGFEKVVRNLHMLRNSLKIETARIRGDDVGLATLVDDIRNLASNIEQQSSHLLDQTDALGAETRKKLSTIIDFKTRQQGDARVILESTGRNLNSLMERHERSSEVLRGLATRWEHTSRSVGEIVTSVQFHDITRQRIEHVIDALRDVSAKVKMSAGGRSGVGLLQRLLPHRLNGGQRRSPLPYIPMRDAVSGCELQAAQLSRGREEMTSAVERILKSLREVAGQTQAMSEETKAVAGMNGSEGESYFNELMTGLSMLLGVMTDYTRVGRELGEATSHVSETVNRMSVKVKEIEKIGIDMKMVALNACIHAAHIGDEGLALSVLAESLHPLSVHTADLVHTLASNLKTLVQTAADLCVVTEGEVHEPDAGMAMTHHLEEVIEPIRQLNTDTAALLSRIEESGKSFHSEIEQTVNGIAVHEQVERIIQEVNADLAGVISEMRSLLPDDGEINGGSELHEVAKRYTMNSEREIHQSILSSAIDSRAVGAAVAVNLIEPSPVDSDPKASVVEATPGVMEKKGEEDLGDNVELF
jgi:methyl-accepting chemotaxis protein